MTDTQRPTALIVTDDRTTADYFSITLRELGFATYHAGNARETVERLGNGSRGATLLVVDHAVPLGYAGTDVAFRGPDLVARLRRMPQHAWVAGAQAIYFDSTGNRCECVPDGWTIDNPFDGEQLAKVAHAYAHPPN